MIRLDARRIFMNRDFLAINPQDYTALLLVYIHNRLLSDLI